MVISPTGGVVNLDWKVASQGHFPDDCLCWSEFHNGVATALSVHMVSTAPALLAATQFFRFGAAHRVFCSQLNGSVNRSWMTFQTIPPADAGEEDRARRAGVLFGFGLLGHLALLSRHDLYRFLNTRDERMTVAVLLGLAIAKRGSMVCHVAAYLLDREGLFSDAIFFPRQDVAVTRTLNMHVPSIVSSVADIEVSDCMKQSALLGLGFLYLATSHRFITEMLLTEMFRRPSDAYSRNRSGHVLASGIALGLTNLARGPINPHSDLDLLDRLHKLLAGVCASFWDEPVFVGRA